MPIMRFNLNGCDRRKYLRDLSGCHKNLSGCRKKPTLSGTVTIMGNTYNTDDIAWQGNYSFDSSGNMFADDNGSYWWATTPKGESFMTDGQNILYAVDANGVENSNNAFDWAGLGNSISNLISTGANVYNQVANSETAKTVQNILKNAGVISDNNSGANKTVATVYPSINYTPYILAGIGLLGLILILRR